MHELSARFTAVEDLSQALARDLDRALQAHEPIGTPLSLPGAWTAIAALSATAIACGYYDQAHLNRDCKSLSGNSPAILLAEDADLARHFYDRFGMSHSSNTAGLTPS